MTYNDEYDMDATFDNAPDSAPDASDDDALLSQEVSGASDIEIEVGDSAQYSAGETHCEFICGMAGTGKTSLVRDKIAADSSYATLSASTGISAVNLNATTIHSLLGFFDTDSLRDAYLRGSAQRALRRIIGEGSQNVVIDEVSMISGDTLDLLVRIFDDVNTNLYEHEKPIGLMLVGDFGQLPPIPEDKGQHAKGHRSRTARVVPWAFDAHNWHRFEANTTKLTQVYRQADARFLAALNYARAGQGTMAVDALASAGVKFESGMDIEFDGTTIVSQNMEVDRINNLALDRVKGRRIILPSRRWGKARGEWKNIPEKTMLRENAYVMLLANRRLDQANFEFVNGDCGYVRGITPTIAGAGMNAPPSVQVELVRTGKIVNVYPTVRGVEHKEKPEGFLVELTVPRQDDYGKYIPKPHYRGQANRYVSGQIEYYPIRLAYASTVHKVQGLTLDRVQIDIRNWMFKQPAMVYVALSRGRTVEGLRLVGMRELLATQCKCDERVRRWL